MMLTIHRSIFAAGLIVGAAFGVPAGGVMLASAQAAPLPVCAQEDGNPDGLPCTWTDPDTGRVFYVDSANYR